jgi:hypothetical protein
MGVIGFYSFPDGRTKNICSDDFALSSAKKTVTKIATSR